MKTCVIIGGGVMDFQPELAPEAFVLCADGGYAHAQRLGIRPDLLIGDFDSYRGNVPEGLPSIRLSSEKDETDLFYCARYALERGYDCFELLGVLGGRIDHTLGNLQILAYIRQQGARAVIRSEDCTIYALQGETLELPPRPGCYLSLVPWGGACTGVSEKGVKYPLDRATLTCSYPLGISNRITGPAAVITVEEGLLLVMIVRESIDL